MKKILVRGPALSRSGYGEQTRFALRSLRSQQDKFDIYLITTGWGATSWITEDNEERQWMDDLIHKTIEYVNNKGQFDMSLQVTIPSEWERLAPYNVGYTAGIETTKLSPKWVESSFIVDKIIVPSQHSKDVFETTSWTGTDPRTNQEHVISCQKPVEVVNFPVKSRDTEDLDIDLPTKFNFLAVAQWGPRKNLESTIHWFIQEFRDNEDVGLILKTQIAKNCIIDRDHCKIRLKSMLATHSGFKCKIYLLHGTMSDGEMNALYTHPKVKAIVSTTHGEGFGLPLFEAAYNGLPVIAPNWSGQKDFLYAPVKDKKSKKVKNKSMFLKVDHALEPVKSEAVWDGVIIKESLWAVPKEGSFKNCLKRLYNDHSTYKSLAGKLKKHVEEELSQDNQYERFVEALGIDTGSGDVEELKIFD